MSSSWARYPFVRFLIPLVLGILTCYLTKSIILIKPVLLFIILVFMIIHHVLSRKVSRYRSRWVFGLIVNVLIFSTGYFITSRTFLENQPEHFSRFSQETLDDKAHYHTLYYKARIIDVPVAKGKRYKCLVAITNVTDGTNTHETTGLALAYIPIDNRSIHLGYGDHFIFSKRPEEIEEPGNPGEFNYKAYLSNKSIFHRVFLDSASYKVIGKPQVNIIKDLALQARNYFLGVIQDHGLTNNEFTVAAALFTGYDEYITEDQRDLFANSGIMHILSVSGLHVGIMFMLTNYFLFFLNRKDRLLFLKPTICISVIWFYAIITGLGPPVCRAAIMFTLLALGKLTRHQTNNYNTLAVAAFILLLFNPRLLFDVGFQLSFSAVAGIFYFQPHLASLYDPRSRIGRYTWGLITISIAAQLATAPLTIFYFHKFPNYFLLSNLIAVPATGIIIYTGAALAAVSFLPVFAKWLVILLNLEISTLNISINYINKLPGLVSDNLHLSTLALFLWIILTLSTFKYILERSRRLLLSSILICILLIALSIQRTYIISHQKSIVFHKAGKYPAISVVNGSDYLLFTDSTVYKKPNLVSYQTAGFKIQSGVTNSQVCCLSGKSAVEYFKVNGKTIGVINGTVSSCFLEKLAKPVDYVYFRRCNMQSILESAEYFKGAVLVFDPYYNDRSIDIEKELINQGFSIHNLDKSGALLVNL